MRFIKNEDAIWHTEEYDVVAFGTSIYNMLTNGLQSKLARKYKFLPDLVDTTHYADTRKYGTYLTGGESPMFYIMFVCGFPHKHRDFLDYEGLEKCLTEANTNLQGKRVMMPLIGQSHFDGNGDRERILEIYNRTLTDIDVDIYDYEQLYCRTECEVVYRKMLIYKYTDHDKFVDLWYDRYNILENLYLNHNSRTT